MVSLKQRRKGEAAIFFINTFPNARAKKEQIKNFQAFPQKK
jgi:hypothetical protein